MRSLLRSTITKNLQNVLWIYVTDNFAITRLSDFKMTETARKCEFIPIAPDNYFRVRDFRSEDRVSEYEGKITRKEIGFFAQCGGKMVGSIWATWNRTQAPTVARAHVRLEPNEALIHDIVTGENFRGMGVGPFMVGRIASALLGEYRVRKIIIDVNVKNHSSLRMMQKAGLQTNQRVFSVSAFGTLAYEKVLKLGA
jgi:RimJ/RimL family protein N-acetyltransferase